ncbi:hypothetical protein [Carboxylicivirga marina]|uniref:hypothetical protein n=1 Tax=Carboxylicivirga marina TaxID=2800988 RepID=UPI0025979FFB|nr:hypothetical protein [uncultured Carboxylicivirga sp.]
MTILKSTLIIFTLFLFSCSKTVPASFWTNFDRNLQRENISDQGPWGGHRTLFWRCEANETFNTKRIVEFATSNGWTFVNSSFYKSDDIKSWTYLDKKIFPLSHEGFNATASSLNGSYKYFPRWTNSDVWVLRFKTGWVSIKPGTEKSNEINGFVMLNKDKNEMTVYHLWGE